MNKTLSVNIGGIVFHIEEQAFDRLNRYLDAIKGYFTASDGRDEIIQDIEGRIAEMFQETVTNGKQVILESDVENVMNIMGRPEQFANNTEDETPGPQPYASNTERKAHRRLFRDADDRVIGGVCSGLSHYMGIDPIYLRLIFAISFFVFGSGFLLYLILMFVMPKAITTTEKLEMKGEPVNISNISRSVASEMPIRSESGITRFFDALGQLISGGFKLLGKIIAGFFIVIGILILIGFMLAFLAILGVGGISIPFFITDLVMNPWQQTTAMFGAFFLIGIPLIMLIFKAIKVLFNIRMESRIINWTALALWIVGIVLSLYVISSIASEFKTRETQRIDIPIVQPAGDTLFVDMIDPRENKADWYYINNHRLNDPFDVASFVDSMRIESVSLDIVKSSSPNFELVQIASARGIDRRDALENARRVQYNIEQENSKLKFDETFFLPKGIKYRRQKIQLLLKVPIGKSVYMSENMNDIIYDIRNVTNTYDGDMVGKTWTMTADGLECIGCNLADSNFRNKRNNVHIKINDRGVKVEGAGNENDLDSSFTVNGKDVDIKINKDGVQIDARKK